MSTKAYNREEAVAYARKWALGRNPKYYDFSGIGGDCANFASQSIYAGAGIMNYKPTFGWYYISSTNRAPAWSGVEYLYNFLVKNKGPGPQGEEVSLQDMQPGDIIQISTYLPNFHHTLVVTQTGDIPTYDNTLIAAHSYDSLDRPLASYSISKIRFIHITAVGL